MLYVPSNTSHVSQHTIAVHVCAVPESVPPILRLPVASSPLAKGDASSKAAHCVFKLGRQAFP
eukprot:1247586-Amphidinium_carterae.1